MSREVIVRLRDDFDGSTEDVETHTFSLDDQHYEIDLTEPNWQRLEKSLAEFVAVARQAKCRSRAQVSKVLPAKTPTSSSWAKEIGHYAADRGYDWQDKTVRQDVRRWAQAKGYSVGRTGLISRDVLEAHYQQRKSG
jgi:hypothetical protein